MNRAKPSNRNGFLLTGTGDKVDDEGLRLAFGAWRAASRAAASEAGARGGVAGKVVLVGVIIGGV